MRRAAVVAAAVAAAGCGSFDDPTLVYDLRVVAMTAEPPEQLATFDPLDPPGPDDVDELGLVDAEVCATVADPGEARRLTWRMTVCAPTDFLRCEEVERPQLELARGVIDDPDTAATAQRACAAVPADPALLLILQDAVEADPVRALAGIDAVVSLRVAPEGVPEAADRDEDGVVYAAKRVRYAPRLPAERQANRNPTLDGLEVLPADGGAPTLLPPGRCAETPAPPEVPAGGELRVRPVEPEGVREDYLVPTLDGDAERFTETLTYQWYATAGAWSRGSTGGGRDASGAFPPLDSTWRAPDVVDAPIDVSLWVVQRDERVGAAVFERCVRVVPAP